MIFTVKIFLTDQITEDEEFPQRAPPPIPKQSSSVDQPPPVSRDKTIYDSFSSTSSDRPPPPVPRQNKPTRQNAPSSAGNDNGAYRPNMFQSLFSLFVNFMQCWFVDLIFLRV